MDWENLHDGLEFEQKSTLEGKVDAIAAFQ